MIVLDTNVVSELARARPDPGVLEWVDGQVRQELAITSVTAGELVYGTSRLPAGRRRRVLEAVLMDLIGRWFEGRVLPLDLAGAEASGVLQARREAQGRRVGLADAQIAGICLSRGAVLATRNTADFEDTGVELIDPWSA